MLKSSWFTVLLLLCILFINIYVAFKVVTYYEEFSSDPLKYGAKAYHINECSCIAENGGTIFFNQSRVWSVKEYKTETLNFTGISEFIVRN